MSCLYPTGRARSTRTSCPSTPSATMFSAAAASPPPPSPTYPLPLLSPSPTPSHPPFTGIVLCHLAVRRCWAARAPRRQRCGASAGRSGRTGPWECGIDTHCAESLHHSEHRIEGEDGTCRQDAEPQGCSGYPIEICRQLPGSRRDILQDILQEMIQDILRGYPTGCTHHPHRISCKDISCRVSYRISYRISC